MVTLSNNFLSTIELVFKQAGYISTKLQGKVANDRKVVELRQSDPERIRAVKEAKTVVDEIVQEMLLLVLATILDPDLTTLSVEEDTPSVGKFATHASTSLVIDPIDGTLEYLENNDGYSICLAIVTSGKMETAFVAFPARDQCYFINTDGKAVLAENFSKTGLTTATRLHAKPLSQKHLIYTTHYLGENVIESLQDCGYTVKTNLDGVPCPEAILHCLNGKAVCYINTNYQMHDLLLPAIIAHVAGGYALDWQGNQLVWPEKGRVAQSVFGVHPLPNDIATVLNNFGI